MQRSTTTPRIAQVLHQRCVGGMLAPKKNLA
jgi:hypothetical protein